jgi:hypothetical protein
MKLKKLAENIVKDNFSENINSHIRWDDLTNSVKNDIVENIYDINKYVKKNYWSPESLKDSINDLTSENQPKFKIEYKDTNKLYNELTQIGWGTSEMIVKKLITLLKKGNDLDPILLNSGKFFDGGHRLTAYKRLRIEKIPTIDIGYMIKFDYEKWDNGEIDF